MDWIGFPSVPSVTAFGAVQGRPAELRYQRHPVGKFTWKYDKDANDVHAIDSDCVIGLSPVSQYVADDYSLLYVEIEEDPAAKTPVEERTYFRTMMITKPPPDMIKDLSPSGRSCWQLRHDNSFAERVRLQKDIGPSPVQVILSTKSGHGSARGVYENLIKPFVIHNGCASHDVYETKSTETISEIYRDVIVPACRKGMTLMSVLVSGDGGVVDLVNSLLPPATGEEGKQATVGLQPGDEPHFFCLIPMGTGNALAHSSGLTQDKTLGMSSLMRGIPETLPTFTVSFTPAAIAVVPPSDDVPQTPPAEDVERVAELHGAVVFSWALHAALVADSDTPAYRKLGAERFQITAKENLFPPRGAGPHPYLGDLHIQRPGDETWHKVPRQTHSYVLATLCARLERTFTVSPASKAVDGKLRLVHFGPTPGSSDEMNGERIVGLMQKAYDGGKHVSDPAVSYEEVGKIRLKMNERDDMGVDEAHGGPGRWRRVCVDGKIFQCEPGTVVEVRAPEKGSSTAGLIRMVAGPDRG